MTGTVASIESLAVSHSTCNFVMLSLLLQHPVSIKCMCSEHKSGAALSSGSNAHVDHIHATCES